MKRSIFSIIVILQSIITMNAQDSLWKSLKDNNSSNGRSVYAIASNGKHIFVGGSFDYFGTTESKPYFEQWDGSSWTNNIDQINNYVRAIHVDDQNKVYIGGDFYGSSKTNYFGVYTPSGGFRALIFGNPITDSIDGPVNAITSDANYVYIAGSFQHVGYKSCLSVAAYDKTMKRWVAMGSGMSTVYSLAKGNGVELYAGGKDGVKKWNGSSWQTVGLNAFKGAITAVAFKNGELYATSDQPNFTDNSYFNYVAHYNTGSDKWEAMGSGVSGTQKYSYATCLAFRGNDLIVGGYFESAGGVPNTNGIAGWDGTKWYAIDKGVQYNEWGTEMVVHTIHVMKNGQMLIGGCFTSAGNKSDTRHVAKIGSSLMESFGAGLEDNNTMFQDGKDIYLGASVTFPDGKENKTFLKWNESSGLNWLGDGLKGNIYALARDNNFIYAGGNFSGAPTKGIARWDGKQWLDLGNSGLDEVSAYIKSIAVEGSNIYIGGNFNKVDNLGIMGIAKWDGNAWKEMDKGITGFEVRSILSYKGKIIVGGLFDHVGNNVLNTKGLAAWNGASWEEIGGGIGDGYINALTKSDSLIIVGGMIIKAGGTSGYFNLAWWNGTVWGKPFMPVYGTVADVAYYNKQLYVVSYNADTFKLQRINPASPFATETLISGLTSSDQIKLSVDDSAVYVSGNIHSFDNDFYFENLVRYNFTIRDNGWQPIVPKGPGYGYINAIASGNKKLFVGGQFYMINSNYFYNVSKWNTFFWEPLNNPSSLTGTINSVAASNNDAYFAGEFSNPNGGKNIIKWNGLMWDNLAGGLQYPVSTVAVNGNKVYAGIPFVYSGIVQDFKSIFVWDGSVWEPMEGADMMPYNPAELDDDPLFINAIAFMENKIFVGGRFAGVGNSLSGSQNIAMYDGIKWNSVGGGIDGTVYSIAVLDTNVYVAGNFKNIGGVPNTKHFAKWNGKTWESIGSGVNAPVYALTVIGKSIYLGGEFTVAGGVAVNNIALWNGKTYEKLGAGVNSMVKSLTSDGSRLFVGGYFTKAGQIEASQLAMWDGIKPYIVSQPKDTTIKLGTAVTLTATILGSQPISYQWYKNNVLLSGETSKSLWIESLKYSDIGQYYVKAINAVGEISTTPTEIRPILPSPQICMVTVDTGLFANKIIWEKNEEFPVLKYKIYQEIGQDIYVPIGEKLFSELSVFNDTFADPNKQSYSYKLTAVDSTGKYESNIDECISHRTMHVVIVDKQGSNGTYLQWNSYNGFSFPSYTIYRQTEKGFDSLSTTPAGYFYNSLLDNYFSTKATCYLIKVNSPLLCSPTGTFKAESGPYSQSLSNIVEFKTTATDQTNSLPISIYPNPFTENITIELFLENTSDVMIEVINALGQKTAEFSYKGVMAGSSQMVLNAEAMNISEGICYLKVVANEKTSVVKCNLIK